MIEGRLVIIGIGNPCRRDDVVGLLVARSLRDRVSRDIIVLERDGEPTALLDGWATADAVILIDAVSSGARPGTLHVIDARGTSLGHGLFRHSTHAFGVAEAVELAKALGKLPPIAWLYGIEGRDFGTGLDLSPEVFAAADKTVEAVLGKIEEMRSAPRHE